MVCLPCTMGRGGTKATLYLMLWGPLTSSIRMWGIAALCVVFTNRLAKELCVAEKEALPQELKEGKEGHELTGLVEFLEWVQTRLLDAGSHCATPLSSSSQVLIDRAKFPENTLISVERYVDEMVSQLPNLDT